MAKDDSIAHGCAGQAFFDKPCQERLDHFTSPQKLRVIKHLLLSMLAQVSAAQGEKVDEVQEFCDRHKIKKQSLAMGIILEHEGDISQVEMARILNINVDTFRKPNWHNVRQQLRRK